MIATLGPTFIKLFAHSLRPLAQNVSTKLVIFDSEIEKEYVADVYLKNMTTFVAGRVKIKNVLLISLSIILGLQSACSLGPKINKSKFTQLNAAAMTVRNSIAEGLPYQHVAEHIQHLSDGVAAAKDKVSTREEKQLLKAYSDLLAIYRDGLLLSRYHADFPFLSSELKGRIYVGQDVEPIVLKYRITTQTHLYAPTGQYWKSIDEDSIRIIWRNADDQMEIIRNLANQ